MGKAAHGDTRPARNGQRAQGPPKSPPRLLSIVLDRLSVLRNQRIHGGATWASAVNHAQVKDGADILGVGCPWSLNS